MLEAPDAFSDNIIAKRLPCDLEEMFAFKVMDSDAFFNSGLDNSRNTRVHRDLPVRPCRHAVRQGTCNRVGSDNQYRPYDQRGTGVRNSKNDPLENDIQ